MKTLTLALALMTSITAFADADKIAQELRVNEVACVKATNLTTELLSNLTFDPATFEPLVKLAGNVVTDCEAQTSSFIKKTIFSGVSAIVVDLVDKRVICFDEKDKIVDLLSDPDLDLTQIAEARGKYEGCINKASQVIKANL